MLNLQELKILWNKEKKEYQSQEVGSGTQKFVKEALQSPELFDLRECPLSKKIEDRKNKLASIFNFLLSTTIIYALFSIVYKNNMKQRLVVTDETILIDFRLVFKAIREEKGDWKKVEEEMEGYWQSVNNEE